MFKFCKNNFSRATILHPTIQLNFPVLGYFIVYTIINAKLMRFKIVLKYPNGVIAAYLAAVGRGAEEEGAVDDGSRSTRQLALLELVHPVQVRAPPYDRQPAVCGLTADFVCTFAGDVRTSLLRGFIANVFPDRKVCDQSQSMISVLFTKFIKLKIIFKCRNTENSVIDFQIGVIISLYPVPSPCRSIN